MYAHPVDDAVRGVQHPGPGHRTDRDRDRERQHDEGARERPTAERPEQDERQDRSEHHLERLRGEREDEGVGERAPEDVVVEHGLEVPETGEVGDRVRDGRVADGEPEGDGDRIADEQDDVRDRRSDEDVAEHLLAVEKMSYPPPGRAQANRAPLRDLGHQQRLPVTPLPLLGHLSGVVELVCAAGLGEARRRRCRRAIVALGLHLHVAAPNGGDERDEQNDHPEHLARSRAIRERSEKTDFRPSTRGR